MLERRVVPLLIFLSLPLTTVYCGKGRYTTILTAELPGDHTLFSEIEGDCALLYRHCRKSYLTRDSREDESPLPAGRLLVFSWHHREYPEAALPQEQSWLQNELLPQLQQSLNRQKNIRLTAQNNVLEIANLWLQDRKLLLRYHLRVYDEASLHYIFLWEADNHTEVLALEEQTLRDMQPKFISVVYDDENIAAGL